MSSIIIHIEQYIKRIKKKSFKDEECTLTKAGRKTIHLMYKQQKRDTLCTKNKLKFWLKHAYICFVNNPETVTAEHKRRQNIEHNKKRTTDVYLIYALWGLMGIM